MSERTEIIEHFLADVGWGDGHWRLLAGDASFRTYFRGERPGAPPNARDRAVLMDAPPPQEDVRPFLFVARRLLELGYSAPKIFAESIQDGLLLLEDFGDTTYTRALAAGEDETRLYTVATDLLIDLHRKPSAASAGGVPPYSDELLLEEVSLLVDWYWPAVFGQAIPADRRDSFLDLWPPLFERARAVPHTLVLRDFHVDNLMVLPERPGIHACGLLDFQDAVSGPVTYDLVSLLEDARRDVPPALARQMLERYQAAFPAIPAEALAASCAVFGVQRSLKIVGIFTRLCVRDGKPIYLPHIPRVWRWVEQGLTHPALAPVKAWLDHHLPQDKRITPAPPPLSSSSASDSSDFSDSSDSPVSPVSSSLPSSASLFSSPPP